MERQREEGLDDEAEQRRREAAALAPGRSTVTQRFVARAAGTTAPAVGNGAAPHESPVLIAHGLELSQPGDAAELDADRAASAMVAGERATVSAVGASVGRKLIARDMYDDLEDDKKKWGADYKTPPGKRDQNVDMDAYKDGIGGNKHEPALVPASQWEQQTDAWNQSAKPGDPNHETGKERKGFARSTTLTSGEWDTILAASNEPDTIARCKGMLAGVNQAFEIMMLDTAQSQALYIAHLAGETAGKLEETINSQTGPRDYDNDAHGHFRGRGPVQVTFRKGYVQSLAYLEKRAEQLEQEIKEKEKRIEAGKAEQKKGVDGGVVDPWNQDLKDLPKLQEEVAKLKEQAKLCREAVAAIQADPKAAADPKYTFLFSAAFLHMSGKVRSSSGMQDRESFDGNSSAAVAGSKKTFDQQAEDAKKAGDTQTQNDMGSANNRKDVKQRVYAAAMAILTGKQKPKEP